MGTHETAVGFSGTADRALWGERQLAEELRAGSVDAFNYLISLYHRPLYRFVSRILGDQDAAADVLQEIFLKVFRSAAHFEGKSSLKTWLYQIALHETSNHRRWWRRHKRQEVSIEANVETPPPAAAGADRQGACWAERLADGGESPLGLTLRHELRDRLQRALDAVPEPFHAALLLREVEGFSYDEIAEITQARAGTVKSRLLRGREMLRVAYEAATGAGEAAPAGAHAQGAAVAEGRVL
ncbi:MAG TPA: sigma-70 family RNA polymerase sigma factor [Terriglobales bacterium]|jgi:RNA polymerase sigma-70 factor (ECF subfamily)